MSGVRAERFFIERYIPSPDVKELIEKENIKFSDSDRATIIYNSGLNLFELHRELKKISDITADEDLKQQIEERIAFDLKCLKQFIVDKGGYVYQLFIGRDSYGDGFYKKAELAIEVGKDSKQKFTVEKHQIIRNLEKQKSKIIAETYFNGHLHRFLIPGSPVAGVRFNERGVLTDYYTYEFSDEEVARIEGRSMKRFENKYIVIPNPFEKGDRVKLVGDNSKVGIVDVSQEDWKRYVDKAIKPGAVEDYVDASITVRYQDTHDHINPIYLEKVYEKNII
ncbi:MAG: hypothetical protein K6B68_03780 [Eubacterium sp.]|nr:hypothetical protein [Eubacterium sp.]